MDYQERLMKAPGEEVVYDDIIQDKGRHRSIGHFSQWGPNRPQHTMGPPPLCTPQKDHSKFRKCVCHPLTVVCTCTFVFVALFALAGGMLMISYYAQGYFSSDTTMRDNDVVYGPGDTQSIFLSPLFCEELYGDPSTLYSGNFRPSTLYLLDKTPTLSGETNIKFQDVFLIFDKMKLLNFHLRNNSVISMAACVNNSSVAEFFLVKGKKVYEEWFNSGEEYPPPYTSYLPVKTSCTSGKRDTFTYAVEEEDQYYLLYVNPNHANPYVAMVDVIYDIRRTVLEPDPETIRTSCEFTTSPCSLRVPLRSSASILLVYGAPYRWGDDWENGAITIDCRPRIWLYAVVSVIGVLVIAVITLCVCCTCCCCCSRFGKNESSIPLLGQHTGDMYGLNPTDEKEKEMNNPMRDRHSATNSHPHIAFRPSNNPHSSPSFKASLGSKFRMGSPTHATFTK